MTVQWEQARTVAGGMPAARTAPAASWPQKVGGVPAHLLAFCGAHLWVLAAAASFSVAAWAAGEAWRRRRAEAALAERVAVRLVPAETFDPSDAEIAWFSGQLASVRTAAGPVPRRAAAARVRVACVDGQVHYYLEGPARAASILQLPGYQDVDVAPTTSRRAPVRSIRFAGVPANSRRARRGEDR